jgi:steroid 5-alpha reductase family enzyme
MFDLPLWLEGLAVLALFAVLGWLLSLPLRNVSIVDSMWSLMFLLAALTYAVGQATHGPRAWLVIGLVSIWSVRLAAYITWRNRGHGEDFRYQRIRANNDPGFAFKSLYIVFGLQAGLAWVISLPLLAAINSTAPLGWLDMVGVALWLVGMVFEAGGDWQLARFKADPTNRGKVLDTGLWRYTRHPNYFGDFCLWWGLFLVALAGGGWWSLAGPLLMSFMLLKVSGVALLERDIGERRPAYRDYVRRTNAFFPGPPCAA